MVDLATPVTADALRSAVTRALDAYKANNAIVEVRALAKLGVSSPSDEPFDDLHDIMWGFCQMLERNALQRAKICPVDYTLPISFYCPPGCFSGRYLHPDTIWELLDRNDTPTVDELVASILAGLDFEGWAASINVVRVDVAVLVFPRRTNFPKQNAA